MDEVLELAWENPILMKSGTLMEKFALGGVSHFSLPNAGLSI